MTRRKGRTRGFTMVELAVVVTIIGILSTIAIYSVRKYIQYAKAAEASEIVAAIKAGEEAYYDETFQYLDLGGGNTAYYPADPESSAGLKIQWGVASPSGCTDCGTRYNVLGVRPAAPVLFRYVTRAAQIGQPSNFRASKAIGDPFSAAGSLTQWFYVVSAVANLDESSSGPMTVVMGSNLTGDLFTENVGQ